MPEFFSPILRSIVHLPFDMRLCIFPSDSAWGQYMADLGRVYHFRRVTLGIDMAGTWNGQREEGGSTDTSWKDSPRLSLAINIINFHSEGAAISPRKKARVGHVAWTAYNFCYWGKRGLNPFQKFLYKQSWVTLRGTGENRRTLTVSFPSPTPVLLPAIDHISRLGYKQS